MDDAARQRAKEVFWEVWERPAAQREAPLDELCAGDPGLRARVEGLIEAHGCSGDLLGPEDASPWIPGVPARAPAAAPSPELAPGARVGPYRILRTAVRAASARSTWPSRRRRSPCVSRSRCCAPT